MQNSRDGIALFYPVLIKNHLFLVRASFFKEHNIWLHYNLGHEVVDFGQSPTRYFFPKKNFWHNGEDYSYYSYFTCSLEYFTMEMVRIFDTSCLRQKYYYYEEE